MATATTERTDTAYDDLDLWSDVRVVDAMAASQRDALASVAAAGEALSGAIAATAAALRGGGRLAYAGAGSSGLIAQLDRLELPGTFGIPLDRLPLILAGGPDALGALSGASEDDVAAGAAAVAEQGLGAGDALVALSASGGTPFTVAALRAAAARGAVTVGIACVAGSPLLAASHHAIVLGTPPEVLAGSTRLAAGTAQKCALNILSTGVALRLGHGYRGLMVNMVPDNAKLRGRAVAIVARAAGIAPDRAEAALAAADGSIKVAVTLAGAGIDAAEARARLARTGGDIRAALRT
ncbi:N-acetylmuramic acid 6-phosphate etherase [Lichenibacterium ramalinae]|uniref:N-acetylmuramic acid 6-phosphate etherase n=1 Tax=Lichenibacterium ramalinae TaxID=2316527 RepID=A0A4Q2RCM3_9HYPH|nr:N-acetylmuramic acid 6-phosphate etherase [Lichenibacterium ramalinae]RYB05270.1 N-acetylmuramic acid 6-phosphate etherase [Lichenibacterium ramalinae]